MFRGSALAVGKEPVHEFTNDYKMPLGYPVEIIPQQNPYALKVGQALTVLCTLEGEPLKNQFVIVGWESRSGKLQTMTARTGNKGLANFMLKGAGNWYVKFPNDTTCRCDAEL